MVELSNNGILLFMPNIEWLTELMTASNIGYHIVHTNYCIVRKFYLYCCITTLAQIKADGVIRILIVVFIPVKLSIR